ncbi:MAG TPA: PAS domain S-box protein [Pyrinomonadaceae bacterium]|nr:PAS domain S-box protein [Pyrinomonadaceae bacterium]
MLKTDVNPIKKDPSKRLAEINRAITTSLNFDQVLNLIATNARQLIDADISLVLLIDEDGLLRIRASDGVDDDLIRSFAGRLEEDVIKELRDLLRLSSTHTLTPVPIIDNDSLDGLLVIARQSPIGEDENWQLSALADQAAIALRNARLYEVDLGIANRERRETLQALRASRARISRILESITDLYFSIDKEWRFVDINRQAELRFGKTRDELIGKVIWKLFPTSADSPLYESFLKANEKNVPVHSEVAWTAFPNTWFEAHLYPSQSGLSVYLRDITERKDAEASRRFLASIVESSEDAIVSKDLNGIISTWNRGAQQLFGYTADEVIGKPITILIPEGRFNEEPAILSRIRSGRAVEHYETKRKRKDGTLIDISLSVSPIRDESGVIIAAAKIARNITEQKRAQEAIQFQASLLDAVEEAVVATDLNGRITYWNSFAEHLYGWTSQEVMGADIVEVVPALSSKDHAALIMEQLREGQSWSGEMIVQRRDGSEFLAAITDSPIFSEKGELIGVVGVSFDVTEAKRAEAERQRLLESEQLARLEAEAANRLKDEFLATLSHELRNPLNVVIGYAEILRRGEETKNSFVGKAAEVIRRNALAQSQLVSDLLDLSRLQMGKLAIARQSVSLSTIVGDAIETVRTEAEAKNISLKLIAPKESLVVDGDPVRLGQIVWNLLNNAVKFTPTGGDITISLSENADEAILRVADTGQGIPPEFLPHVFEIFRQADASSSRRQGGLGIGLALVKQLAELHGGGVKAESEGAGKGSRFTVWLPLYNLPVSSQSTVTRAPDDILKHKLILVVDDSRETTEMLSRLLQMEGAFVQTARSGREAIKLAADNTFDLVISDISMPEMDGYQLLRQLRQVPSMKHVPALALTGFGRISDVKRAQDEGFAEHFTKPLDIDQLLAAVKRLTKKNGNSGAN